MRLARAGLAALALLGRSPALGAQDEPPGRNWSLGAGAILYRVSDVNGWAVGPAVTAQRRLSNSVKLDINAAALLSSDGFYDFSGVALDLGPSFNLSSGRGQFGIGGGISGVAGGDSDGTGGGWAGGYLSAQGTLWMSPRIGLTARGSFRQMSSARTSPSVLAALMLRL